MKRAFGLVLLLIPMALAACAMTEVSNVTPPPAVTLSAPPVLNMTGSCDDTKALESWLQVTTELLSNFQTQMNVAAGQDRVNAYQPTLDLAQLRDSTNLAATPDCAQDIELNLSNAMNRAVGALQSFVNGESSDITSVIAEVNMQLDQVRTDQLTLIERLTTQIQSQVQQATAVP